MSVARIMRRFVEPVSQTTMILGIVALCQPWSLVLHSWGATITLVGLVGFSVATKFPLDEDEEARPRQTGAQH